MANYRHCITWMANYIKRKITAALQVFKALKVFN